MNYALLFVVGKAKKRKFFPVTKPHISLNI